MSIEGRNQNTEGYLENREKPLKGKIALVTGSSRDIGAGIAIALAKEGVIIIGNYLNKEKKAKEVIRAIKQIDGQVDFVQADITIPEDRARFKEPLESFGGKLDYLVLNTSGNIGTARSVCVSANNALVSMFLPKMSEGGKIILMQSIPGHFYNQLKGLGKIPDFYEPIAEAKHEGEQSLQSRIPELQQKDISFIVVCPPEVEGTFNMKLFKRRDETVSGKHAEISDMLGIPRTVMIEDVGQKVAELLKRNLSNGYVELFRNVLDRA